LFRIEKCITRFTARSYNITQSVRSPYTWADVVPRIEGQVRGPEGQKSYRGI